MMSSVSKAGVADSSRLNERSAITIATPIAGKSFTRRPSQVNQWSSRLARFGALWTGTWPVGHTAHAKTAPPRMRNGIPSHSRMLPFGRSMRSPTPAKVVMSAMKVVARRDFDRDAIRSRRFIRVLFFHPVALYKKARRRLSGSRGVGRFIYARSPSMESVGSMKVVGGSASVPLARGIAKEVRAGFVDVALEKHPGGFPDGERYVRLLGPVAGEHVVLVQTTHPDPMIVELLLLADAIRDAGARRITAVVPYFGYGRQDKRFLDGEPISAKTIAKHIGVDCDELLTMAIPANPEILQTFPLPVREVSGMPALRPYLKAAKGYLLLAPDEGAPPLAQHRASHACDPLDLLPKQRIHSHTL